MSISTNIWDRLKEVLEADNLDQVAEKLDMNPSTLRGRKSRGAIPYDEIVQKLDAKDLAYVLKGEKLDNNSNSGYESFKMVRTLVEEPKRDIKHWDPQQSKEASFENYVTDLMHRIESAPFSKQAKLRIIDSVIRIVEQDLDAIRQEKKHHPDPKKKDDS